MLPLINNLEGNPVVVDNNKISMRQYDGSPIIQGILDALNINFNTNLLVDNIYNQCWDITSCKGLWLDIWGRKVAVDRGLQIPADENWFGFDEIGNDWYPFDDGIFYSSNATQTYLLSDEAYRLLIMSKAASNITACDCHSLNSWMKIMFAGRGNCYMQDNLDMSIAYVFEFDLQVWEIAVLTGGKVLPRPAGISATLVVNGVTHNVN